MKRTLWWGAVAFGAALGLIAGLRLDGRSLAVVIGVLCGLAAALPMTGTALFFWWRERGERLRVQERLVELQHRPTPAPPVIVVQGGRSLEPLPPSRLLGTRQREFTVVGQEEEE